MTRNLTVNETSAIAKLAGYLPSGEREQLLLDIKNCVVNDLSNDGLLLQFIIENYERPQPVERDLYAVEGLMENVDGTHIDCLIFKDQNNRLLEFELVKWTDHLFAPLWDTFHFSH